MILKGQAVKWSKEHSFKCNYQHFCQWASCLHGLLCTMLCKPTLVVPVQYLGLGVHSRGKHGRTSCVTRVKMKRGRLLGVVIGFSSPRGLLCPRLPPSWRLWNQKMMLHLHHVPQTVTWAPGEDISCCRFLVVTDGVCTACS